MQKDYATRFESFADRTFFGALDAPDRAAVREAAFAHRLTFQELRQVAEASRDLAMWGEGSIGDWLRENPSQEKAELLAELRRHMAGLRSTPKTYREAQSFHPTQRESRPVTRRESDQTIFGMCPVASPKTVCCNLRTIDAVENCSFGCTYCSVQTFYHDEIKFDDKLAERLASIELEPDRFYHIGTGQSSDALAWGNKLGMLDALYGFAAAHPEVLLEFKTKSDNIRFILENDPPANIVCSWSLNTPTIVENEEHFTASLDRRIAAARKVADRGVRVAFHFHPMVHYDAWREDYTEIARRLVDGFDPAEVSFLSMGSVTLIKPVIRKIRELGNPTKMLQMDLVKDPHGKLTYPDAVKVEMFEAMNAAFAPWHEDVFMYLCMEKTEIWEQALGRTYTSNEEFEHDFALKTARK
jgi:spore photoproduct lyase